ncbi:M24 family metallopeptidase [Entomospira entomophila]|uniref:M24 family metallopeptidase n=1 Tax=Entomospira entomophila TaxID=2719988 RepID=A0A968GCT8_9SPIO|nr:aminopeptidase P family protein [Entomospira entomophilus]NIZ41243.1 M24 family metallopeptidase [Entomospira entomophilus]WDI35448.1 M24 family metallopeptidase [Entomospira entomophilus]
MNSYHENIKLIRQALLLHHLDAYIFFSGDPHASEYVADRYQARAFFSHFHGSAGTFVVTQTEELLWTDARYYLEAEALASNLGFTLMRDGLPQTPTILTYLMQTFGKKSRIGLDGSITPATTYNQWQAELERKSGITLLATLDLYEEIHHTRPTLPNQPIYPIDSKYTGKTAREKIQDIVSIIENEHCDYYLTVPLDSLAYLTNLRGSDVTFNPFFYGYLLISKTGEATLFCATSALTQEAIESLTSHHIAYLPYEDLLSYLLQQPSSKIYASALHTNTMLYDQIKQHHEIILGKDFGQWMKLYKNHTEQTWLRTQYIQDGIAYIHFLKRLADQEFTTEHQVALALTEERQKLSDFRGESFPSIVGNTDNGAIVHYRPTAEHHKRLEAGFTVIDSGAHYWGATTDITRTPYLGNQPSLEEKRDYTLVLKAHIAMAKTPFPKFATGAQIDGIVRSALWQHGIDFGHGTGHGVGAMLSVHEEPFRINKMNTVPISAGMVVSNEPGIYHKDKYGIRIENIYIAQPHPSKELKHFLHWEPLTMAPIHTEAIDLTLLDDTDINWLNDYHQQVSDVLSPHLSSELLSFLKKMTTPITR